MGEFLSLFIFWEGSNMSDCPPIMCQSWGVQELCQGMEEAIAFQMQVLDIWETNKSRFGLLLPLKNITPPPAAPPHQGLVGCVKINGDVSHADKRHGSECWQALRH